MTDRLFKLFLALLCLAFIGPNPLQAAPEAEPIRGVVLVDGPASLPPGREATVRLMIGINQGFKINAHKPAVDWIRPTVLEFDPQPGLKIVSINYPPPTAKKFPFADQELLIYEKMVPMEPDHRRDRPGRTRPGQIDRPVELPGLHPKKCASLRPKRSLN